MEQFAAEMKAAFAPGKLDPLTKELVYLAISIANQCDYCIASHGTMARSKGMTDEMHEEFMRVVLAAQKGNKITTAYRVPGRRRLRGEVIVALESSTVWDANLYLKFADARMRPALDLMGRLDPASGARPGHAIYDLGCGAGNISRILAERFPRAPVVGIDSSEQMLDKARSQTADRRSSFAKGDLAHFKPDAPPSILYSNAAYQWVRGPYRHVPRPA